MAPNPAQTRRSSGRDLREARRELLHRGSVPAGLLQPQVARSWARSWQAGLQPCGRMPGAPHASGAQLARALDEQRELVAHAQPVMQFLAEQVEGSDSIVLLAGADGLLLQAQGDMHFASRAERVALRPGAVWREQYRGTNAIGTALAEGQAVVVHGAEHYLERNAFLTCAAAPIFSATGSLLGVLDVSGDHRGFHRHTLALVRSAARMIEHRLFDTRHEPGRWGGLRLRLHRQAEGLGTITEAMLALRGDGVVAGANAAALALLGLQWQDIGRLHVDDVLADPLERLLHWCVQSPGLARVVHTRRGEALWLQVEGSRMVQGPRPAPSVPLEQDALAALDTGDAAMHSAIARARKLLGKPIPLLLQGESGAGKEVFARAMHASGPRAAKAFVAVNCAALPETLIEAELFGYERGAFTGALREGSPGRIREAHGGTLFLDEIGDMPLALQARLLRVLQDGQVVPLGGGRPVPVDFALVCATHRDLPGEMAAGRFREDLFYRLNGFALRLPALRERSDRAELVARELRRLVPARTLAVAPDLLQALLAYRWPGNMRQLASTLRTACALLDPLDEEIGWEHLADDLSQALRGAPQAPREDLRSISLAAVDRALADSRGNHSEAARRLGVSRNTLYRKLKLKAA
ncbi:sigma-54-dependent Fis family transcriptional regulator [Ramlibacter albus]|uniref:Sigma-54-dependent Fis family transcriptional regulator n=1 Tax=Ramlibacter albus TaxID=2079448 RepID=A0A923M7N7_9BURK|nr:sigma-54-dependent Fis family transcriptional regulator [Ramlibacter albus]MBC5764234.1 sigma-54-dependent Fis family transcriptional regulator [Ramlibacter albus]